VGGPVLAPPRRGVPYGAGVEPTAGEPVPPPSTQERLVEAAAATLAERGYDGAGVQEIAARAGMTTGAIYANFRGKGDLLGAAIASRVGSVLDALLGLDTSTGPDRPEPRADVLAWLGTGEGANRREALVDAGRLLVSPGAPLDAGLLLEALAAARRDPDVAALVGGILGERRRAVSQAVEQGRAGGGVAPDVSVEAASALALVLALGSLLLDSLPVEPPPAAEWQALLGRVASALGVSSAPAP